MQNHLNQAKHNEKFHNAICDKFDDCYFDWKITSLFYSAIHYLKALSSKKNIDIGDTHHEIEKNINPFSPGASMRLAKTPYRNYKDLYSYSRTARYDGFVNYEVFQKAREADYIHCLELLERFKKYIKSQDIPIE